jgi:uncharacterized protein (TIGR02646 family)
MKRIQRLPLSQRAIEVLLRRAQMVAGAADPRAEARRLWKRQSNKTFQEIRDVLKRMATGIERCMYCEDSQGTAIEHFWPKSVYPERAFDWFNYLIACSGCNSNVKRDQFPLNEAGEPFLVNPTEEDPLDHLSLITATGDYHPLSLKGDSSIGVFGLNRTTLSDGRRDAWVSMQSLLVDYAYARERSDDEWADSIERAVRRHPFAGVLATLLRISQSPDTDFLVSPECLQAIQAHPKILGWI